MATAETRLRPNILVTGTPGTGKTTFGDYIAEKLGLKRVNCGQEIHENKFYLDDDEPCSQLECRVLDEEKLLDHIEDRLNSVDGGYVVDYHGCDFFPERWFDIVIVLRCNNTLLYDRLKKRNYSEAKIRNNVECEIFDTLLEEANESYKKEIVHELWNETIEQMSENYECVRKLISSWKK